MSTDIYVRWEIRREGRWEAVELLPPFNWETATQNERVAYLQHPAIINSSRFLAHALPDICNIARGLTFAPGRGLPDDVDTPSRLYLSVFNSDDLSFVYLSELLTYDWQPSIEHWLPKSLWTGAEPFTTVTLPYLQTLVEHPDDLRMLFALN